MNIKINSLINRIYEWDMEDINHLKWCIDSIKFEISDPDFKTIRLDDLIDVKNLPTNRDIDKCHTSYPIWAVDKRGFALAGEAMDQIVLVKDL
jgi:hypothetical protein